MQPFSFTAQGDHLAPQSNMSEALALVRAGKLDAASRLLMEQMGASRAPATPPPAPRPSSPFSAKSEVGRAARLLRGACAAGEIIDVQAKPVPATVPDAPAAASSSGGKAAGDAPGAFARVPFQHGGAQHPYFLYTPSTPAPAMGRPLVLMLHGCTQDAQDFARGTRMNAAAEAAGALVLYPSQASGANANGCWNWFRPQDQQAGAGEPALLLAMVRDAMASQAVDARRVYVTGISNGGMLAYRAACQIADTVAAIGVQSATLEYAPCHPSEPVSLLHIHGTADTNVPLAGGQGSGRSKADFRPPQEGVATLAAADGCGNSPTVGPDPTLVGAQLHSWRGCPTDIGVQFVTVPGGTHPWMSTSAAQIWSFLAAHPRPKH